MSHDTLSGTVARPPVAGYRRLALQGGAAALLLATVVTQVGYEALAATVLSADPILIVAALALVQVQIVLSAIRWRYTARRLGLDIPVRTAVAEYYLASLLNMLLPGGLAGDAVRAFRSRRLPGAATRSAVRAVVLERASGQIAFAVVAAVGLAVWAVTRATPVPDGALAAVAVVPAGLGLVAAGTAVAARLGPGPVRTALADLGPDIRRSFGGDLAFVTQAALSLMVALSYVAVFALCGAAVGAPLDPAAAAGLIPLALLSMLVPFTIGGWGVREAAAAILWPLAGLTALDGAATAALYGIVVLVGALPGAISLVPRRRA